jgi:hypothetical protein
MKRLLIIMVACVFIAACNNAAESSSTKDSVSKDNTNVGISTDTVQHNPDTMSYNNMTNKIRIDSTKK